MIKLLSLFISDVRMRNKWKKQKGKTFCAIVL